MMRYAPYEVGGFQDLKNFDKAKEVHLLELPRKAWPHFSGIFL